MFLKYADAEIDSDLEIAWNTPVSKALSKISDDYELPDLKNFYISLLASQSPQVKGKAIENPILGGSRTT